jgi:tRNA threonylcarbamoyladenosine biosynthesis protein TsaB
MIITIRTDKPESEIGLYKGVKKIDYFVWQAHRELAETIHKNMEKLLKNNDLTVKDISGAVVYKGPGSFTGLRIGISVGNALSQGLGVPLIGQSGNSWRKEGIIRIINGEFDKNLVPEYGAPVHITSPKK